MFVFRLMTKLPGQLCACAVLLFFVCARSTLLYRRRLVPFALAVRHHGAAIDVPQEALLCHQVEPGAGGEDAWCVRFSTSLQLFRQPYGKVASFTQVAV